MKNFLKILGIIFLCVIIILAGLSIWQHDKIKAFITSVRYSETEINNMLESSQNELVDAVEEFTGTGLRELTDEEKKLIESGKISKNEIMSKIVNETIEQKIKEQGKSPENITPEEKTAEIVINEHISRLYTLKASFVSQIDAMLAEASSEYYAIAENGAKGKEAKQKLIPKYINILSKMESSCNSEFEEIVSSLTKELKARGHSLDIIKTIRASYANEKSIKMAQIINEYS